jgi:UDP-2,4-diacetamido-2,4,6-trideoxy-beta-L-altropyranose hydrolase
MRVTLHCDSSRSIGSGHAIRSLALAAAIRDEGGEVEIACDELLDVHRRAAEALNVPVVRREEASRAGDWLVTDGYHLDEQRRSTLAPEGAQRLVVDDLELPAPDAAIIVNGNLYASPGTWSGRDSGEHLLGPAYALLAAPYAEQQLPPARDRIERVLVTMGSADPDDATRIAVEGLAAIRDIPEVRVVIGPGHPAGAARRAQARAAGFDVLDAPLSLVDHLTWADVVVSACGTTALELARLGRPVVGIVIADNQRRVADAIEQHDLGRVAGRHPGVTPAEVAASFAAVANDAAWRRSIAVRGPHMVDGRGARRVARALRTGPLDIRPANVGDGDRLLAWRNDAEARRASFDQREVTSAEHTAWLHARLDHPDHLLLIGEVSGMPIGVIRFAMEERRATASVALDAGRRGGGIGARLIAAGVLALRRSGRADVVDAWVRPENRASATAFRLACFREVETSDPGRLLFRQHLRAVG